MNEAPKKSSGLLTAYRAWYATLPDKEGNHISEDDEVSVITHIYKGYGCRAIERMTEHHRDTVARVRDRLRKFLLVHHEFPFPVCKCGRPSWHPGVCSKPQKKAKVVRHTIKSPAPENQDPALKLFEQYLQARAKQKSTDEEFGLPADHITPGKFNLPYLAGEASGKMSLFEFYCRSILRKKPFPWAQRFALIWRILKA